MRKRLLGFLQRRGRNHFIGTSGHRLGFCGLARHRLHKRRCNFECEHNLYRNIYATSFPIVHPVDHKIRNWRRYGHEQSWRNRLRQRLFSVLQQRHGHNFNCESCTRLIFRWLERQRLYQRRSHVKREYDLRGDFRVQRQPAAKPDRCFPAEYRRMVFRL